MFRPKYQFEWNNNMYQTALMNSALNQYVPSAWGQFKQSASYAFHDNSFIHAVDYIESFTKPSGVITKEEFNKRYKALQEIDLTCSIIY